jgi:hypothetical protein
MQANGHRCLIMRSFYEFHRKKDKASPNGSAKQIRQRNWTYEESQNVQTKLPRHSDVLFFRNDHKEFPCQRSSSNLQWRHIDKEWRLIFTNSRIKGEENWRSMFRDAILRGGEHTALNIYFAGIFLSSVNYYMRYVLRKAEYINILN